MFMNYIKIAFRNLIRNKIYSIINILGLAIAMTVFIIILLWCRHELNYDHFLPNIDNLYRVNTEFNLSEETKKYYSSPEPTGATLKDRFPEITHYCQFYQTSGLMVFKEKKFSEKNLVYTNNDFLTMFSIQPVHGDIQTMLQDPYSIVLTQTMSQKYFGDKNPLGKTIRRNDSRDYIVTGVIEDFPDNATYNFDFLMSVNLFKELEVGFLGKWNNISGQTFIMVDSGVNEKLIGEKIWGVPNELSPDKEVCFLWMQPLSKIHLYDLDGGGAIQYIYIFIAIGLIVLIIACINFMNLSTARSSLRAKEVGLRKVSGAQRGQLIRQFYFESILQAILAMIIAIAASEMIVNSFERFEHLNSSWNLISDYKQLVLLFGITIFTGVFAGSYPALFLSGFNPITVLKGIFNKGRKSGVFRYTLVVVQFSLSIALIISTLIVFKQMNYMKKHDLGFNKNNLLYLPIKGKLYQSFPEFKAELTKIPGIKNITRSSSILTDIGLVASGLDWDGKTEEDDPIFSFEGIDYDYLKTCKMELVTGREYSRDYANDEENYILNETAIKRIGYKDDPIGKPFNMWGRKGNIIGVVKDFNYKSLSQEVDPLILTNYPDYFSYILIRIDSDNIPVLIENIKKTWINFETQFPFDYNFMDQDFEKLYDFENKMGSLFKIFTVLAVFISSLGLFGLSMFVVDRRTKEIGVRKVLGASVSSLVLLLVQDFTKWVTLSNIIAWPLAWLVMKKWLQNYAFRTQISAIPFILAGLTALIISMVTVYLNTYQAANSNPVEALKYE